MAHCHAEADFDLVIVDIPDRTLTRKMIHLASDRVRQGWMGRQLPKLFREAGLIYIVVTGHILEFVGESYRFRQRIQMEEQAR